MTTWSPKYLIELLLPSATHRSGCQWAFWCVADGMWWGSVDSCVSFGGMYESRKCPPYVFWIFSISGGAIAYFGTVFYYVSLFWFTVCSVNTCHLLLVFQIDFLCIFISWYLNNSFVNFYQIIPLPYAPYFISYISHTQVRGAP